MTSATVRPSVIMYGYDVRPLNNLSQVSGGFLDGLLNLPNTQPLAGQDGGGARLKNKTEILDMVTNARPLGGARRVGNALSYVCDYTFGMRQSARGSLETIRPVPKVIVITSAGASLDMIPTDLSCFSQTPVDNYFDVAIIGVGIGDRGTTALKSDFVSRLHRLEGTWRLADVDNDVGLSLCNSAIHACPHAKHDLVFLVDG